MASSKLKILLFGSIGDEVESFSAKIRLLQASRAGPFDAAFGVGRTHTEKLVAALETQEKLPLPVYLQDYTTIPENIHVEADPCIKIAENLHILRRKGGRNDAGIWTLSIAERKPELVVVCCPPRLRIDSTEAKDLVETLKHVSYIGCDLLLSSEWPQGVEQVVQATGPLSFDVADIALKARARYHVAPGSSFAQSVPFGHLAATTNTAQIQHTGRFISLAPVLPTTEIKAVGKTGKFVHALGLQPLLSMAATDLAELKACMPCPFTDASYDTVGSTRNAAIVGVSGSNGLSEASARRILAEEKHKGTDARWKNAGNTKRPRYDETTEVDPSCHTLFIHGLHKDPTGRLQTVRGNVDVLAAFKSAEYVRMPPDAPTSSFCFVDFPSHEAAKTCLDDCQGQVMVNGVVLSVDWAKSSSSRATEQPQRHKRQRLTEAMAKDSTTVFYKFAPGTPDLDASAEQLRKIVEETLEDALADGENRVTAQEEPALRVQVRIQSDYGFLEFASHAAASMALATLTGSTDGGRVLHDAPRVPSEFQKLILNWAMSEKNLHEQVMDASGFKFQRKHFPADSRRDCWFCLASEDCEKHLIVGVYDTCYAAMPKGPMDKGHVLLIPVQHSNGGALQDARVSEEMEQLKAKLRKHARDVYRKDLFVFERAIQTKGGYHTHVQCIPVDHDLSVKIHATLLTQAQRQNITLREIRSDLGMQAILNQDNDSGGYFYVEVPSGPSSVKRFLYQHHEDSDTFVPLQFGREILAAVWGKPELAHWKSCLLDEEQETELTTKLRESFEKYQ